MTAGRSAVAVFVVAAAGVRLVLAGQPLNGGDVPPPPAQQAPTTFTKDVAAIVLPAGTTLRMEYVYDNSAANPNNPQSPPQRVTYGQRTTDEMAELWFQVVPRNEADRATLAAAVRAKVLREEIVGHEKMLETDPRNVALHDGVALLHAEVGNVSGTAAHFAETVRVNPQSPAAHYNYGMALFVMGKIDEAGEYLANATALNPGYALAYDALGLVRQIQGRIEEALAHFERAVKLNPANADARRHLDALKSGKVEK